MIVCPDKNLKEWKDLSTELGDDLAHLSFFRNNNSIPTVDVARDILRMPSPQPAPVTRKAPAATTPQEVLSKSLRVRVTLPEGANQLRITTKNGKRAIATLRNLNAGDNPFHGVEGITKVEAGVTGVAGANRGKFVPVKGEVKVEPLVEGALSLSTEAQTETPQFKAWFGNSKVVGNGKPLVVFHGTAGKFYAFHNGIAFFTPSRAAAADYRDRAVFSQHDVELPQDVNSVDELGRVGLQQIADEEGIDLLKGEIMPVFLSIQKPLDLTDMGPNFDPKHDWDELHKLGLVDENWKDLDEEQQREVQDEYGDKAVWVFLDAEGHNKIVKLGYDGVIFDDVDMAGGQHTAYAVFKPTQIKSAVENVGTFDPNNPDIRASVSTTIGEPNEKPNLSPYLEADAGALAARAGEFIRQAAGAAPGNNLLFRNRSDATYGSGAALDAIEKAFGRKILFMDFGPAAGAINGFVIPDIPSVIFINTQSENAPLVVVGHELFESLKISSPELYEQIISEIGPTIVGLKKWHDLLSQAYREKTKLGERPIAHSQKELVANFIGDSFADPEFWKRVQQTAPNLFQKVGRIVLDWLRNLLVKLKGFGSYRFFNDIQAAHDVIARGLEKFAAAPVSEAPPSEPALSISVDPTHIETEASDVDGVEVQIGGQRIIVPGTERLTAEQIKSGQLKAQALIKSTGIPGHADADNVWAVEPDGFNYDAEGRKLITALTKAIREQSMEGADAAVAPMLVRAINYNLDAWADVFSPAVADELRGISAGESSMAGQRLRMMQGKNADVVSDIARNLNFYLRRTYAQMFGGDAFMTFTKRVLAEFGRNFTDAELARIAADHPEQEAVINKILAENHADQGGRVYRKVQQLLKPKSARKLSKLEADAKVNEAAQQIIERAAAAGIHPPEKRGKPLSPIQKLLLMIQPENVAKLTELMETAVKDAERNAGVKAALNAAPDREAREDLEARFYAGEEPTEEQIATGMDYPEFEHWKVIKDNLLRYVPVTEKLAGKIVPKATDMARMLLNTPAPLQPQMKQRFMDQLTDSLGLSDQQASVVYNALEQTYGKRFTEGRARAMASAVKSMTPREAEAMPRKDSKLWRKIEQFFNAGGEDVGQLLNTVAALRGYPIPSEADVARMKTLAARIQQLKRITPAAETAIRNDPAVPESQKDERIGAANREAEARNSFEISKAMQQMGVYWARMIRPIVWPGFTPDQIAKWWAHRGNLVDAAMDYATHDVLSKFGFATRLITHVFAGQMLWFSPTRMMGRVSLEYSKSAAKDLDTFWKIAQQAMADEWAGTLKSVRPAALAFTAGVRGRRILDKTDHDRVLNSMNTMSRIHALADEHAAKGDHVRALLLRIWGIPQYVGWFLQAVDGAQKAAIEYPEMLHNVAVALRAQGKSSAEIAAMSSHIVSMMTDELHQAAAETKRMFETAGQPTDGKLSGLTFQEIAAQVMRRRIYEYMRQQGLPADDFEAANNLVKRANAWQEKVEHGPGALASMTMSVVRGAAKTIGLPAPSMVLANAIGTGMNYALFGTPFYKLADLRIAGYSKSKHSPFFASELDRHQRAWMALAGTLLGALVVELVLSRDDKGNQAATVRKWPKNKAEAQLWAARGSHNMTIEFNNADGSFTPISLLVGPLTTVAPYAFAAQAVSELLERRVGQQRKADAEAAKLGVPSQPIPSPDAADMMAIAGNAFLGTLMSNRTASGMWTAGTEYGVPNLRKIVSSNVSSLVPLLPGYQEVSRMMGITLDPKTATVADFMVPTPDSPARERNMLGEPVETPDDVQRVMQVLTAGTFPFAVTPDQIQEEGPSEENAAYTALFASGYRPPAFNPTRGYAIGGQFRPLNHSELAKYTALKNQYFKANLAQLGATATPKTARAAYQQASAQALGEVGVSLTTQQATALRGVAGGAGRPRRVGIRKRSLRVAKTRSLLRTRAGLGGIRPHALRIRKPRITHPRSLRIHRTRPIGRRIRMPRFA